LEQISVREKCTKQPVLTVVRNVKFHLSHKKVSQFIAEIVMLKRRSTKFLIIV